MCMLRHREMSGSSVPTALLYSSRRRDEVIYHDELVEMARRDPQLTLFITLTREAPLQYWSRSLLFSTPARRGFVAPDLAEPPFAVA